MPAIRKQSLLVCIIGMSTLFPACRYYKATLGTTASIDSLEEKNRYFILRSGDKAYHMANISLSEDHKRLEATLDTVPANHRVHLQLSENSRKRYKKPEDFPLLNEVHLYTAADTAAVVGRRYALLLDQVEKMEVIGRDVKRTTNSFVFSGIAIYIGSAALVTAIILAVKSSCPFVSAYDGKEFILQGEIYGGAIYPQLERTDFLPLKMAPLPDGTLQIKISNELKERQYTDLAELWAVTHDKNTKVLMDDQGKIYTVRDARNADEAWLHGRNVSSLLEKAGDNQMLIMDDTTAEDARNHLILKFKNPGTVKDGKLLLAVKNSYWLDLLYGELARGFGNYYGRFIKQQRKKPVADLKRWISEQQLPLEASIKTAQGWKIIAELTTIGPLATREILIPVENLSMTSEFVEIRLSSGFMFWDVDYAAMDFSDDLPLKLEKLSPEKATDEKGTDVLGLLQKEDGRRLEQPQIGNVATIVYTPRLVPQEHETKSYFLKSRGYYEHIRNFKNKPDISFLKQFTRPNAFPKYGLSMFIKAKAESIRSLTKVEAAKE